MRLRKLNLKPALIPRENSYCTWTPFEPFWMLFANVVEQGANCLLSVP